MSTEENKTVVRRFISDVLGNGNISLVDQLFAPNYVNRMTGQGVDSFKPIFNLLRTAIPDVKFPIDTMVAEGDQVVARFTITGTYTGSVMGSKPTGQAVSIRGLAYYRLANGRIVEDDPMMNPDLMQLLGVTLPTQKQNQKV